MSELVVVCLISIGERALRSKREKDAQTDNVTNKPTATHNFTLQLMDGSQMGIFNLYFVKINFFLISAMGRQKKKGPNKQNPPCQKEFHGHCGEKGQALEHLKPIPLHVHAERYFNYDLPTFQLLGNAKLYFPARLINEVDTEIQ